MVWRIVSIHGHEYWSCINLYIRASHDDESTEVYNARSVIEGLGNIYVCMWQRDGFAFFLLVRAGKIYISPLQRSPPELDES